MKKYSVACGLALLFGCVGISQANPKSEFQDCQYDSKRKERRSRELQRLVIEDQADRNLPAEKIDWRKIEPRDEARRKRVGEIFGEGCYATAADYAAAALVFQHGNSPDHFFQTYLWAKRAVELGDVSQKSLMAKAIDRYLVNTERKQLYATQANKKNTDICWCLEKVETTFPDDMRTALTQRTLSESLQWIDSLNADHQQCIPAKFCAKNLKDSPRGTVPGVW